MMDRSNSIHPTAIIEGDVEVGANNKVGAYALLQGPLRIGDDNIISPHVVIGSPGQDTRNPRYDSSACRISIGDRNIIREFTAIQKPCYRDLTSIGNDVFLMQSVHIPHDAVVEDGVVITPMCVLAGLAHVMTRANLGMGCTITQYSVVGAYSIVATGAAVTKNVKPFSRYIPGHPLSVNHYAVKKFGLVEHAGEIEDYVLRGARPRTAMVEAIVARYEGLCATSGKAEY